MSTDKLAAAARELVERWMGKKHPITMRSYVSDLIALIEEHYVKKEEVNLEVEKRIAEIDQHGRIAVSVIKKKLWSMRFNEDDVKRETDGRRKRFIYGYTEAINDIAQWLTDTVSQNTRCRLTNPNNNPK
jgi:enoyl-CoA hydratase/carnithine racemase